MSTSDQSTLMRAIGSNADAELVEEAITAGRCEAFVDRTDPRSGVTPLMLCSVREDTDETVRVAEVLMRYGARVDTRDSSGPGCTALLMAAQEGKAKLLTFLIGQGATLDTTAETSSTQPICIAAQHGHALCVAKLAEAAAVQGKHILEAASKSGTTPSYVGVERGLHDVVGVLAKAGADLRRACPVYFSIRGSLVDPMPDLPEHFALNATVRSFVSGFCAHCGDNTSATNLQKCSRCRMAYYCSRDCQKENFSSHKRCCKGLRKGQDMFGNPDDGVPDPPSQPYGFEEAFGAVDQVHEGCEGNYDRETHPVWEYDAGGRGNPNWCRYPARIEASLESLLHLGSPRYMYRPGNAEADGMHESDLSVRPPPGVATRYVYYCDMVEREIYTGAARSVRRNGERKAPESEGLF